MCLIHLSTTTAMCRRTKESVERVLSAGVQSIEELRKLIALETS